MRPQSASNIFVFGLFCCLMISESTEAIVNGNSVSLTNRPDSVAGLLITSADQSLTAICTATFITPRILISAGHCFLHVGPNPKVFVYRNEIDIVDEISKTNKNGIRAKSFVVNEDYISSLRRFENRSVDVALVELEAPVKSNMRLPVFNSRIINPDAPTIAYGFGVANDAPSMDPIVAGAGILRSFLIDPTSIRNWPEMAFSDMSNALFTDETSESAVCEGDSGGPLFQNEHGRLRLVGVNESVAQHSASGPHKCLNQLSVFVAVKDVSEWIS